MIFSKLFKAKWQHKDSNIRISAINEELSTEDVDQKATLMSLLENDESELVRRSVLLKINNFDTWLLTSESNSNGKIKEYAYQQVEQILFGQHAIKLSTEEKVAFINNQAKKQLLDAWLKIETDDDVIIALFNKLAKAQLILPLFKSKNSQQVQSFLIEQTQDQDLLEKLLKRSTIDIISERITAKIAKIVELKDKPKKIEKQAQLLLAKLLALKDLADYQQMLDKKADIIAQWQTIQIDFSYFNEQEKQKLITKYAEIEQQLAKVFVKKAEDHQQQLITNKLSIDKQNAQHKFSQWIKDKQHLITTSIFENSEIDEGVFNDELTSITQEIESSVLNSNEQSIFASQLKQLQSKLSQLPEIAQSVTQATHLISKISQLALPTTLVELSERHPVYQDWLKQWQLVKNQASGVLPESIVSAHQEIVKQWNGALSPLLKQQKHNQYQLQKLFTDLNRLITQGKYNAAFGVFKKAERLYLQLNLEQQQRMQREYDSAKEKIAELSDWEHYIATPRKKKLLEEVKVLVNSPLDNPNEQAAKVKAFRNTWNSLGHAEDDVEKTLNVDFNLACEQAFAPCRFFFSEQEKLRAQHLTTRLNVIEKAKELATKVVENDDNKVAFKVTESDLSKLQQQWRDAGEVDRTQYKSLNLEFNEILKPVKSSIAAFHQNNIDAKKKFIVLAEQLSNDEDVYRAINEIKALQIQWKAIGYCGKQAENELWQKFRTINDSVFAKRQVLQSEDKAKQSQFLLEVQEKIEQLTAQKKLSSTVGDMKAIKEQVLNLHTEFQQSKARDNKLIKAFKELQNALDSDISTLQQQDKSQHWQNIFACMISLSKSEPLSEQVYFTDLSAKWQKRFTELKPQVNEQERMHKTLELEILTGNESPSEYKAQRMMVQVALMKEQMSSGNRLTTEQLFDQWFDLGMFTANDVNFIERIKKIYC